MKESNNGLLIFKNFSKSSRPTVCNCLFIACLQWTFMLVCYIFFPPLPSQGPWPTRCAQNAEDLFRLSPSPPLCLLLLTLSLIYLPPSISHFWPVLHFPTFLQDLTLARIGSSRQRPSLHGKRLFAETSPDLLICWNTCWFADLLKHLLICWNTC